LVIIIETFERGSNGAKTRLAAAPEIPTVDEAGLPGFYITSWLGVWAPTTAKLMVLDDGPGPRGTGGGVIFPIRLGSL
jgi:Tripartite tricarboxylate transporter family receptor